MYTIIKQLHFPKMYIYKNAVDFVVTNKMTNNTKLNLKRFEKKKNQFMVE